MEKFPRLNYAPYYEVFLQKVIKTFTTLSDPPNEECIKFFINTDSFLKTRSIVRSIALCLVSLMVPKHYPEGPLIWSSI